jgi:hypothetical protein
MDIDGLSRINWQENVLCRINDTGKAVTTGRACQTVRLKAVSIDGRIGRPEEHDLGGAVGALGK